MSSPLQLDVFVVPYKPIVGLIAPMGEGEATTSPSTIVYIPSLDAVVSGDVAYNGVHQWLAQTDHDKRMQWIASVERIEAPEPKIVVAGHKRPDARDDDPTAILGDTKTYIRDFDHSLAESRSAQARHRVGAADPGRRAVGAQRPGGSPRRRRRHGQPARGAGVAPAVRRGRPAQRVHP
jgi:hypothetical protein